MNYTEAQIIEIILKVGKEVKKNIRNVNHGGCGVYALALGKELAKRGIRTRIRVAGTEEASIVKAREHINTNGLDISRSRHWHKTGVEFYHVMVQFLVDGKWVLCDTDYIKKGNRTKKVMQGLILAEGELLFEELEQLNEVPSNWNYEFNRKQIASMQNIIEKTFAEAA